MGRHHDGCRHRKPRRDGQDHHVLAVRPDGTCRRRGGRAGHPDRRRLRDRHRRGEPRPGLDALRRPPARRVRQRARQERRAVGLDPGTDRRHLRGCLRDRLRRHDRQRRRAALLALLRHHQPVPRPLDDFARRRRPTARSSSSSPTTARSTSAPTATGNPTATRRPTLHLGGHVRDRLDRVPHRLRLHGRRPDLHAVQARQRHRPLDAAQGRRRCRLRHPVPRHEHDHRRPTALLFRAYQNANLWLDDVRFADQRHRRTATPRRPRAPLSLAGRRPPRRPGRRDRPVLDRRHRQRRRHRLQALPRHLPGVYGALQTLGTVTSLHRHHGRHRHHATTTRSSALDAAGNESATLA